jgi:hypothetical protein
MSIGRCFVGALHGPSDKANDKVSVVNWNSGIRMAPSSKYCSAQRYAPATDTPRSTSVAHGAESALGHYLPRRMKIAASALSPKAAAAVANPRGS